MDLRLISGALVLYYTSCSVVFLRSGQVYLKKNTALIPAKKIFYATDLSVTEWFMVFDCRD